MLLMEGEISSGCLKVCAQKRFHKQGIVPAESPGCVRLQALAEATVEDLFIEHPSPVRHPRSPSSP